MNHANIRGLRLRNQFLTGKQARTVEEAVRALLAVQAQDFPGATWGLGQRVRNATHATIERAYNDGAILRTHVLRPTWHFVLPEDIRWLLALTAPRIRRLMTYYDRQLEIDAGLRKRSAKVLRKALRDRTYLTRAEISRAYADAGIEATGQRLGHIVMHAELDALICSGPMRGKQFTYALLDERAPGGRELERDAALVELTSRFFAGHGPATAKDLAWWSGLTVKDAQAGIGMIAQRLSSEKIDGITNWFDASQAARRVRAPQVRLLPNYDEYLIAYRNNAVALDPDVQDSITNDDLSRHFIVIDGKIAGGWRTHVGPKEISVTLQLFRAFTSGEASGLDEEIARFGVFWARAVRVVNANRAGLQPARRIS